MTSQPYAFARIMAAKRAASKAAAARTIQAKETAGPPATQPAASAAAKPAVCISQAKHRRIAEMLRDLRTGAEALSANADGLLSRLS